MPELDLPPGIAAPASENAERITFFAVGRQGYGNDLSRLIANSMEHLAVEQLPHFIALAGDNFYPRGVRSVRNKLWASRFETQYTGPHLLGTPFYPVAGNHDHCGNIDAMLDYSNRRLGTGR